jgi:DNA polymerase-1
VSRKWWSSSTGNSGPPTARPSIPGHKANRPGETPLPIRSLPNVKRGLNAIGLPWIEIDEHEADDVIASAARHAQDQHCFVFSRDRDFYQLLSDRVHVLNTSRAAGQRIITPEEITQRFQVAPSQ